MSLFDSIIERARVAPSRIAFPEATNEKMLQAVKQSADQGICVPVLVGKGDEIKTAADEFGIDISNWELFDSSDEEALDSLIERFVATAEFLSVKTMKRKSKDPFYVALMMTALDDVDGVFAGIDHSTGDVIVGGQMVIGMQEGATTITSMGILEVPGWEGSEGNLLGFGDSAVCVDPSSEDLAGAAICAADTIEKLFGWEPRVALLSFSTDGSSEHALIDKVREAVRIANELRPELAIDGEFQLDTAIDPKVAAKKMKRESRVAGKANFIMYPNLEAGNIGVKLCQQFAHANAPGPFLLGFKKVVGDCSRGAPVEELVGNIAVCSVRAQR